MADTQSLTIYQGMSVGLDFTPSKGPVDLTSANLAFHIFKGYRGLRAAILSKTTGDGIGSQDANGNFTVTLAPADTAALPLGTFPFDVQRTDASVPDELANGTITVLPPGG